MAFSEVSEEYHNELYGFIEAEDELLTYKFLKPTITYKKNLRGGNTRDEQIILTEYIRHQIHHPENTYNLRSIILYWRKTFNEINMVILYLLLFQMI